MIYIIKWTIIVCSMKALRQLNDRECPIEEFLRRTGGSAYDTDGGQHGEVECLEDHLLHPGPLPWQRRDETPLSWKDKQSRNRGNKCDHTLYCS